mmetsp:Transcript_21874/g.44182  ORF Transcript_21874/g.44182 Transcript_21874/m.44182 type:complete len:206 (+) Transcript_21874:1075-1692(+)
MHRPRLVDLVLERPAPLAQAAHVSREHQRLVVELQLALLLFLEHTFVLVGLGLRRLGGALALFLGDDDARAVLADKVGDRHEGRHVDERLPHHARVHAHRVAVIELPRACLEEHLLRLVEQIDHVLRLEQREVLLVAELLRERELGLLPRPPHRGHTERHGERVPHHHVVIIRLETHDAQVGRTRRYCHRALAHLGLLAAGANER